MKRRRIRRRFNIHKNSRRSPAVVRANLQLASSVICLLLAVSLLLMSGETFAWFSVRWGSTDTTSAFASGFAFTPNLVMWTYDTKGETGNDGKWTCKYSDYADGSSVTEEKGVPKIGTITTGGSGNVFTASVKDLTFGEINDLVNASTDNDVYFRFATDVVSTEGDTAELKISYPDNYVQCYGYTGTKNAGTEVTAAVNAKMTGGDSLSDTGSHRFFNVEYMVIPIGYSRDTTVTAANIATTPHFVRTMNDTNNKREFKVVTTYEEGVEYYKYTGIQETKPAVSDAWTKDTEPCNTTEHKDNWQTLDPESKSVTLNIPEGTVRYYVYVKLSTNLNDEDGLRTVLKNLYEYMPCYFTFDLNMSLEIQQIGDPTD